MRRVVGSISTEIVIDKDGLLYCGICKRGTFTKRGLYLHLLRVHRDEILEMVEEKSRRIKRFYSGLYNS